MNVTSNSKRRGGKGGEEEINDLSGQSAVMHDHFPP